MAGDRYYEKDELHFEPIAIAAIEALERVSREWLGGKPLTFYECGSCESLHVFLDEGGLHEMSLTLSRTLWRHPNRQ